MRARLPLLGLAAVAVAVVVAITQSGSGPYTVRAEFLDADGLRADYAVREQGVVIGRVADVAVTRGDTALATLDLSGAAAPIGTGASVSIHPSNLLGEKYVDLQPGDTARPLPSGARIPLSRTSTAPELDQVLGTFNSDTRRATAMFLTEQGASLLGRGPDLAALLRQLPGTLNADQQLISGLAADNHALGTLVDQSDQILTTITPRRAALGALIGSAQGTLQTLASREAALGSTVASAPAALVQLRRTLDDLHTAAVPIGTAAAGLQATASPLTAALRTLPGFTRAALPALAATGRAAPVLEALGTRGTGPVRALVPVARRLDGFAQALAPVATVFDQHIGQFLDVLQGWARAISDRDGIGHVYRIEILLPFETLFSLLDITPPANPLQGLRRSPARHHAGRPADHTLSRPTASHPQPAPVPGIAGAIGKATGTVAHTLTTVTSQLTTPTAATSPSAVKPLLNYLLGR